MHAGIQRAAKLSHLPAPHSPPCPHNSSGSLSTKSVTRTSVVFSDPSRALVTAARCQPALRRKFRRSRKCRPTCSSDPCLMLLPRPPTQSLLNLSLSVSLKRDSK
eukprot:GHVU01145558.1.p2 GENE.GHVU01145558.1~~GHVU01145558.1.p2  ORF type:complete len:105 (+),score=2.20 GHVU01145558.1:335-649(+)